MCNCTDIGLPTENITFYSLKFSDDWLVIAQGDGDQEYMTRKSQEECEARGSINFNKKYLSIWKPGHNVTFEGNDTMVHCNNYKYLGMQDMIQERTVLWRYSISTMNGILWTKSYKGKKYIYKTVIKILYYTMVQMYDILKRNILLQWKYIF